MDKSSHWHTVGQGFAGAILTAALTLCGLIWQQGRQEARADHTRILDEAQTTAQETSQLLYEGYDELAKLVVASQDLHSARRGHNLARMNRLRLFGHAFAAQAASFISLS
jgi:hypothetical protein